MRYLQRQNMDNELTFTSVEVRNSSKWFYSEKRITLLGWTASGNTTPADR